MVRDCYLSYTDYFIQHHDILHQAVRQRLYRNLIGARIGIRGDSFIFQGMGLCQQSRHIPSDAVRADTANYRSNTVSDQISQRSLRRPRVEAALSASSKDMLMAVDKSRDSRHALCIYLTDFDTSAEVRFQILTECGDSVS